MESKLIVKNFGPIKNVEMDLRNVNVFIGPQSTGKSALAKIYTIVKAPRKFLYKISAETQKLTIDNAKALQEFEEVFIEYNIHSFLKKDTEIKFESELHAFTYKEKTITYEPKLLNIISNLELLASKFEKNKNEIIDELKKLANKFIFFYIRARNILSEKEGKKNSFSDACFDNLNKINYAEVFDMLKLHETDLSTNTALYIPAERNFINIIKKSALNLILNKVPIPKHILSFGAELEKLDVKEIDLSFIQKNLSYKNIDGEDKIYFNNKQSIMLTEAASGIQSVVPILSPILKNNRKINHHSFVIEEPELNLFPSAQYDLIQLLESNREDPYPDWADHGSIHTYTTHSPYILSALNNLLYAYKVKQILNKRKTIEDWDTENIFSKKISEKVNKIVKAEIKPESFTAYQIKDGHAELIFNRESGLIDENYIDEASDQINSDFDELMELTK